uniref:ABC transporter ATP-binding protein n=1 Tax=Campylobacter sp. TaxID=205 RepID=UPI0025BE3FFF
MLIEAFDLGFYYSNFNFCFRKLNFNLNKNENLAILGLNGQGKSTLLSVLMNILKPKEGFVKLNTNFSYLSSNLNLPFDYKVLDVVLMGRAKTFSIFSKPSKNDVNLAFKYLEILEIKELADKNFNTLSSGQRQLILLARALCGENEILFLDEPMSALDFKNQNKILNIIKKLNQDLNISVVFSTHNPAHAFAIATNTLILYEDLSYEFGKTILVLNQKNQEKLYKIPIKNVDLTLNSKT